MNLLASMFDLEEMERIRVVVPVDLLANDDDEYDWRYGEAVEKWRQLFQGCGDSTKRSYARSDPTSG